MEKQLIKSDAKTMGRIITRSCSVCSKKMRIQVFNDGNYALGNYFFAMPIRGKNAEYWECNECYDSKI